MSRSSSFQAPALGARLAADRDQDLVGRRCCALACRRLSRPAAHRPRRTGRSALAPVSTSTPSVAQAPGDRPRQLGVVERQDARQRLDHGDLGAELGEGGAEFQPDIAGADHGQPFGHRRSDSASVEEITAAAERQRRQLDRHRAGGEHDVLGADRPAGRCRSRPRQVLPSTNRGQPCTILTLAFFSSAADAAGQPADDAVLPRDRSARSRCVGRSTRDAERRRAVGLLRRACRIRRRRGSAPWTGCSRR